MKKIPTLFKRVIENHKIVDILPEITEDNEEAFNNGIATVKIDGSCCAIIDGNLYLRYDAKKGKKVPDNAIKCQDEPDPVTGHLPCWIPYNSTDPGQKWFGIAYENALKEGDLSDGTYEAIGKHFNGNMYNMENDILVKHGTEIIDVPRTFEGVRDYLKDNYIEGIVFWLNGEPKCKIKRSDFGFDWQEKHR